MTFFPWRHFIAPPGQELRKVANQHSRARWQLLSVPDRRESKEKKR